MNQGAVFFCPEYKFAIRFTCQGGKSNVGFHAYIYANSADWNTGSLKLHVHDGDSATDTNPTLLATGEVAASKLAAAMNKE